MASYSSSVSFSVVNENSVKAAQNSDLLPSYEIKGTSDAAANKTTISNIVTDAINSGDSMDQIADTICANCSGISYKSAMRTARTARTAAANAGTYESICNTAKNSYSKTFSYENVKKEWSATLDMRTRLTHGRIDGERVGLDDTFSNGLLYPADPNGTAAEVYNCRCTILRFVPGIDDDRDAKYSSGEWQHYQDFAAANGIDLNAGNTASSAAAQVVKDSRNIVDIQTNYIKSSKGDDWKSNQPKSYEYAGYNCGDIIADAQNNNIRVYGTGTKDKWGKGMTSLERYDGTLLSGTELLNEMDDKGAVLDSLDQAGEAIKAYTGQEEAEPDTYLKINNALRGLEEADDTTKSYIDGLTSAAEATDFSNSAKSSEASFLVRRQETEINLAKQLQDAGNELKEGSILKCSEFLSTSMGVEKDRYQFGKVKLFIEVPKAKGVGINCNIKKATAESKYGILGEEELLLQKGSEIEITSITKQDWTGDTIICGRLVGNCNHVYNWDADAVI